MKCELNDNEERKRRRKKRKGERENDFSNLGILPLLQPKGEIEICQTHY